MKKLVLFSSCLYFFTIMYAQPASLPLDFSGENISTSKPRILVFTKTAVYHHQSIPAGVRAITELGKANNFSVQSTADAGYFNDDSLKNYAAVIFLSTTGDVLNGNQQAAFERFIRAGGGFVGVHSATDTEYDWPWYNKLVGAYFANHPKLQNATINVIDKNHPSTSFLPGKWQRFDEWYNFKSVQPGIKILCKLDETTYEGGTMGSNHPFAWYHDFDGGRAFYTAGGHTIENYSEPLFLRHLLGGIKYAITRNIAPSVRVTRPGNNTVYAAPATITINASATDADGKISNVKFYNGKSYLKTDTASPYTYTLSNASKGTYTLTAKATDNTGLQTISKPVTVTVLQPSANKAPAVSITRPANNAVYTAPATFTISAEATDADGSIKNVKFYSDGILLKTENISPYTCKVSSLGPGYHLLKAVATDNKGAFSSSSSVTVAVSVPLNKAPVVRITIPVSNVVYASPGTINISATASDADGTIKRVQFYRSNTLVRVDSVSPYSYTMTNVPPGSYSLVAKATDNKGLTGLSASIAVQVNKPPVITITSPVNNATYFAPASVTVKATASDADGTINNVKFYNGTTYLKTATASPFTYTLKSLAAGTYKLTAKATDNTGDQTISAPVTIKVSNASFLTSKPVSVSSEQTVGEEVTLSLAPNPVNDILDIYPNGFNPDKPITINVISFIGVVLKNLRCNGSAKKVQLDVSSLQRGVYIIKVTSDNTLINKKFVKL